MAGRSKWLYAAIGCLALTGVAACEDNAGTAGWVDVDEAATPPAAEPDHAAEARDSTPEQQFDGFGYYIPTTQMQFGNWRLDNVFIAPGSDLAAWEAGDMRDAMPFGPVFVDFSDVTSPTGTNELGGEYHTVTTRVRADTYRVEDGAFTFEGTDPELGTVIIDGVLHGDVVRAEDTEQPAITGGVEVGGERIRNTSFYWYGGD